MAKILGISAFYHDSAAALCINGMPVAAAQEERFTRIKHTPDFPVNAIRYCLQEARLSIDELDAVVFYDKPLLKFERLLQTYQAFAPSGLTSFLRSMPLWLKYKLFLKKQLRDGLSEVQTYDRDKLKLLFSEHHLSHAGSAFYVSGFDESAILTVDGVGEWCTASLAMGKGKDIKVLKEMHFPHSVGLLYSAFTWFLGFSVNSGEYKLMGLAPYGDPDSTETAEFERLIRTELMELFSDGSVWLNQAFFRYATGLRMIREAKWERLFGMKRRKEDEPFTLKHANLALAIQRITEDAVLRMASEAKKLTGSSRICLSGGVALNCVANGKLLKAGWFDEIYIQPASGDAGGALGAALAAEHMYFDGPRRHGQLMQGALLGPRADADFTARLSREFGAVGKVFPDRHVLCDATAELLAGGAVVGWFEGRMEFGPRALGHRSILADPGKPGMQQKVNLSIKFREGFRPFAPAVPREYAAAYFDLDVPSPYMLLVAPLRESRRKRLPDGFSQWNPTEKLSVQMSDLPAVTHVDYSARVQTVDREEHPEFHALLCAFGKRTGYPVLVNTSFNVRGEPPVCTPEEAWHGFMSTGMDALVIENVLYLKKDQPGHEHPENWRRHFQKD